MTKMISILALLLIGLATFGQANPHDKSNMSKKIFYDFVNAINERNVDKIYSLMADDYKFIDAHGNEVSSKDKMKAGWTGYFQWFPDYKIEITDIFSNGDTLAALGFASGTFKGIKTDKNDNYWRLPAAWKVLVNNNKIKLWQVYADTKIPFDIINKNK
ncbi:MAG TPA: nuclear transport factor 2 family protein [Puia sp.]|nr:nuclear transport factor 2 family protein [Puia sp.]